MRYWRKAASALATSARAASLTRAASAGGSAGSGAPIGSRPGSRRTKSFSARSDGK